MKNLIIIISILIIVGGVAYWYLNRLQPVQVPSGQVGQNNQQVQVPEDKTPNLPKSCTDQEEGAPVIISMSVYSGPVGTKLEIKGCNFSGFEGDKNIWIENSQGVKGFLMGEAGSTNKLIKVTLKSPLCQKDTSYSGLPCDAELKLTPGTYKIYTMPWGKKSNEVEFKITQ